MSSRLFQDRGLRFAIAGLGLLVVVGVMNSSLSDNARKRRSENPALDVRAVCRGRNARGAIGTLRPRLSEGAERAGKAWSTSEAPITGMLHLELPAPTPPGFDAELLIGSEGCLTTRDVVRADRPEQTIEMRSVGESMPPVDLRDPPVATGFPPGADEEHVRKLRMLGTGVTGDLQFFDGQVPTCAQCHVSTGEEHARGHGKAPSGHLVAMAGSASAVEAMECVRCHAPVHAAANRDLRAAVTTENGFSCSSCHRYKRSPALAQMNGLGVGGTFVTTEDRRAFARGGRADTSSSVMAVEFARELKESGLCITCHSQTRDVNGRAVMIDPTGAEHEIWAKSHPDMQCQSCHFPRTEDPFLVDGYARWMWGVERTTATRRSHARVKSREEWVRDSVRLDARWEGEGTLVVEAENGSASHALPGVAPFQAWKIEVVTTEKTIDGRVPEVVLARTFLDARGDACALPWEAAAVGSDSRLMPQMPVKWSWRFSRRHGVHVRLVEITRCEERAKSMNTPIIARIYKEIAVDG